MSDYDDLRRENRRIMGIAVGWYFLIFVLVAVTGLALWGFGVFTSGLKGQGEAYKQKNSANNRIFAQQNFEKLNQDIDGYVDKIKIAKQALAEDKSTGADSEQMSIDRSNLRGARNLCVDAVKQYNADSRSYTLRDFKSAGLPPSRDTEECIE